MSVKNKHDWKIKNFPKNITLVYINNSASKIINGFLACQEYFHYRKFMIVKNKYLLVFKTSHFTFLVRSFVWNHCKLSLNNSYWNFCCFLFNYSISILINHSHSITENFVNMWTFVCCQLKIMHISIIKRKFPPTSYHSYSCIVQWKVFIFVSSTFI